MPEKLTDRPCPVRAPHMGPMPADDRFDDDQPGHDSLDDGQSDEGTEDPTQERVNPLPPLPDIGDGAATDKASACVQWYNAELLFEST
jgi:hypothetical protein